jgi:hypothetical protein
VAQALVAAAQARTPQQKEGVCMPSKIGCIYNGSKRALSDLTEIKKHYARRHIIRSGSVVANVATPSNVTRRCKRSTTNIYLDSQGIFPSSILFKIKSSTFFEKVKQQN